MGDIDEEESTAVDPARFITSLLDEIKGWWEAQKQHTRLYVFEKLGNVAGRLLVLALVAIAAVMLLVFASLALAIWLGHTWGSLALGFLAVAGFYLLLLLVLHFGLGPGLRKAITLKVINLLYADER